MRVPALLGVIAAAVAFAVAPAPAAQAAQSCPAAVAKQTKITAKTAHGLDVSACGPAKAVVVEGLEVAVPAPGMGLAASAVSADGTETAVTVTTDRAGIVTVTTENHAETATRSGAATTAVTRCSDTSYKTYGMKWSSTPKWWVNSVERVPSNISRAAWETIAGQGLRTWKRASNSCSLTRTTSLPGTYAVGSTRDGNVSSVGCTTPDSYSTVDFGGLGDTYLGLTCTSYLVQTGTDRIVAADIRIDNSSRAWVTSATGCTGARYDLASTVTHEFGHAIGLDHAAERGGSDLTMSPSVTACNVSSRLLGLGDLRGLLALYPS